MVWALPRSLATTCGITVVFFSCGYLDVSVPHVSLLYTMDSCTGTWVFTSGGFPHSDTCGSMAICASPQLFAAYHVLHRLLVPRHPPYALHSLTSRTVICFVLPCQAACPVVLIYLHKFCSSALAFLALLASTVSVTRDSLSPSNDNPKCNRIILLTKTSVTLFCLLIIILALYSFQGAVPFDFNLKIWCLTSLAGNLI